MLILLQIVVYGVCLWLLGKRSFQKRAGSPGARNDAEFFALFIVIGGLIALMNLVCAFFGWRDDQIEMWSTVATIFVALVFYFNVRPNVEHN